MPTVVHTAGGNIQWHKFKTNAAKVPTIERQIVKRYLCDVTENALRFGGPLQSGQYPGARRRWQAGGAQSAYKRIYTAILHPAPAQQIGQMRHISMQQFNLTPHTAGKAFLQYLKKIRISFDRYESRPGIERSEHRLRDGTSTGPKFDNQVCLRKICL
jgi:hypothetical protein